METANCIRAPKQLDRDFFTRALENGLQNPGLVVKNVLLTLGNEKSDSHCSESFRFYVGYVKKEQFDTEAQYVIAKTYNCQFGETDANFSLTKEKCFFVDILPHLEGLLNNVKLAPCCYYATSDPIRVMVFEDMGEQKFEMAHRECGLDEDHARFVLKKLGQFHAASIVLTKEKPSLIDNFNRRSIVDKVFINKYTDFYKVMHKALDNQIRIISEWPCFEKITEKLRKYQNNFETRVLASQAPSDGEIKVLNHGHFDIDNILCKYDPRSQLEDVVFIEFSYSIYGSLGIDLNHFFFTSVQVEVLKNWKQLLEDYHASLCYTLMELGFEDIPTFEKIEEEFVQNFRFGLLVLVGLSTMINLDKKISDGNNFRRLMVLESNGAPMEDVFMSEPLLERLKYSLLEFDKVGALD